MFRGARFQATTSANASVSPGDTPSDATFAFRAARLGCVALAGVFLANCANNQVAQKGRSKEYFPSSKYGPASARVVNDGEPVPKGGGRELVGNSYSVAGKRYTPYNKPVGYTQVGLASWYGSAFHGRRTANGEVYDRHGISAAHPTMPLPAYARVTNMLNNRSMIVRVNDRGPFHSSRVMDLSQSAADALAFRHLGTARIKLEYLGQASLNGSDDKLLLATLRTDGSPAPIPGTSAATMVASNAPVAPTRSRKPDLDEDQGGTVYPQPEPRAPVAQAYAPQPAQPAMSSPAATLVSTAVTSPSTGTLAATPVRAAPLPPSRPFDLDTIANAGKPVAVPTIPRRAQATPPLRPSVASLFTAPESEPSQRFSQIHPLNRVSDNQALRPLARN